MDGSFVKAIMDGTAVPRVETVEGEERLLLPAAWKEVEPPHDPEPVALSGSRLDTIVTYLRELPDGQDAGTLLIHVESPTEVSVRSVLMERNNRHYYVSVVHSMSAFPFGTYHEAETFIVQLLTCMARTPERDELVAMVSAIRDSAVNESFDDGYAQKVTVARGVATVGSTQVPNPVRLVAWRTFPEVEQPISEFWVRLKSGAPGEKPKLALFEIDNNAWALKAVASIKAYFEAAGLDVPIVA